ncbi:MAG: thioredoxin family protein [Akkermansiaceae bacterium]|jgi:thiol:disulfide interchange protein
MKILIKLAMYSVCVATMVSSAFASAPKGWETDLDAALEIAKKEKKAIMLEFTGSDWCPPCIMMGKKVFSKEEFYKEASKKYVLVHLDFPKADEELKKKNQPHLEKYNVEGFPTVVLLDSEGKEFGRFIASKYPEIKSFLEHLALSLENKDLD